jgi:acyl-CoA reductase-like NAD-dependent aldehyde dehydrogenase
LSVRSPWTGQIVGEYAVPDAAQVEQAIAAADDAVAPLRALSSGQRATALRQIATGLDDELERWAHLITVETGKPIKWSRIEVSRAASILRIAAEEAVRINPHAQRLDGEENGIGRLALTKRVVRGPVLAVTPFNFPLHLVVHKLAPALAAGAPVIIKPSPKAPGPSLVLAELVAQTSLPAGSLSVLLADGDVYRDLLADPRLPVVSFTGSDTAGWQITDALPRKRVITELGGNAAAVIAPDYTSPDDLVHAATRIALFSNYSSGQACTSPQRVYVPRPHFEEFAKALVDRTRAQVVGDPFDDATDVGAVIDEQSLDRISAAVDDAVRGGATVLTGGKREGTHYLPTVLTDVPESSGLFQDEIFGPVVHLVPYDDVEAAFTVINRSRFGLAAGVFTRDLALAFGAFDRLDVGSVVIGDAPTYRSDYPAFGGVKDSGRGREGVRAAIEEFTYERVLTLTDVPL